MTDGEAVKTLAGARRVLVIGCSGSGKSTFSRALSEKIGAPHIPMDRAFFWMPGWQMRERGDIRAMVADAVEAESWIIDGTSPGTMDLRLPRADAVVFFRLKRLVCLASVIRRRIAYHGRPRPDMADNCPEKIDLEFLRYIWNFEKTQVPEIMDALARHGADVPVVNLTSRSAARRLLAQLNPKH